MRIQSQRTSDKLFQHTDFNITTPKNKLKETKLPTIASSGIGVESISGVASVRQTPCSSVGRRKITLQAVQRADCNTKAKRLVNGTMIKYHHRIQNYYNCYQIRLFTLLM